MRLRTTFGFERFMATKKKAPAKAAEEPKEVVEEKKAPAKAKKAPAKPKMLVGLEHLPCPDMSTEELPAFITLSYHAMLGRDPLEVEMAHHLRTVERHKRPRTDIHIDIRKSGEYQGRHPLVPSNE